jgi:hypothetical protein
MPSIPTTRIRRDEQEAHEILRVYLFGGLFGTDRPPRGIDPAHLLEFIERRVPVRAGPSVYRKTLHAIRFYELEEAVPYLVQALDEPLLGREDLQRSCLTIQAAADVGAPTAEQLARLCQYFDDVVVPHADAPGLWPLLMETRMILAPHGSDEALVDRLAEEVVARWTHERDGEAEMMAYDAVAAVQRNDLPRSQQRTAAKLALRDEPDERRRCEGLVDAYLGRRHLGTTLEEWAGRCLRWLAFRARPEPVWQALARAIDAIDRSRVSPAQADIELVRAVQAILYLGGTLSPGLREQYESTSGVANFLWDDPEAP